MISVGSGVSAFNLWSLYKFLLENKPLVILLCVTVALVYLGKRVSKLLYVLFVILLSYKNLSIYFLNFDKVVLLFSFLYLLFSIYFFVLWYQELEIVVYWPGYKENDVGVKSIHNVNVELTLVDEKRVVEGVLTNWGEFECFTLLNGGDAAPAGRVRVRVIFENKNFFQEGTIVTSYAGGVGIKFKDVKYGEYSGEGWLDFFTIISHRGYSARNV